MFVEIIERLGYDLPGRVFWCFCLPHIAIWILFKQFTDLNSWDSQMSKALAKSGDSCFNSSYTHSWASCLWSPSQYTWNFLVLSPSSFRIQLLPSEAGLSKHFLVFSAVSLGQEYAHRTGLLTVHQHLSRHYFLSSW